MMRKTKPVDLGACLDIEGAINTDDEEGEEEVISTSFPEGRDTQGVEWVNDPTPETKAKVQPYVDKVLAIFKKRKKAHKIGREIHILNRDMEKYIDFHCKMKWFNEGRRAMAHGTNNVPFCKLNVPCVVQ